MSASLVGSEMCIRDRRRGAPEHAPARHGACAESTLHPSQTIPPRAFQLPSPWNCPRKRRGDK
eukprot:12890038-Alexandrium_andersonii.AAC.1